MPFYGPSAAGGAVTREGGNTTEATTTSFTAVDLLAVTSLTPDITKHLMVMAGARRSSSGSNSLAVIGLKINSTIVNEADIAAGVGLHIWGAGSVTDARTGSIFLLLGSQVTNYLGGVMAGQISDNGSGGSQSAWGRALVSSGFLPGAAVISVIFRAEGQDVTNPDPTIGIDEAHVYSLADS